MLFILNAFEDELRSALFEPNITFNVISDLYEKFIKLFVDSTKLESKQVEVLARCCIKFINCIHNHIDCTDNVNIDEIKRFITVVEEISQLEGVKDIYLQCVSYPILEKVTDPDIKSWFAKQILKQFNLAIQGSDKRIRYEIVESNYFFLCKLADLICTCGDYDYQEILLESMFHMCTIRQINHYADKIFPTSSEFQQGLCSINKMHFDEGCRTFLNMVNSKIKLVLSLKSELVQLGNQILSPPKLEEGELPIWVDFNLGSQTITIFADRDTLRTGPPSEHSFSDTEFELISINIAAISKVYTTKYPMPESANSVGHIIMFKMNGPCSFKFPSSAEISKATVLKMAVYYCPELNELVTKILPNWFGKNFRHMAVMDQDGCEVKKENKLYIINNARVYNPLESNSSSSNRNIDVKRKPLASYNLNLEDSPQEKLQKKNAEPKLHYTSKKREYKSLTIEDEPIRARPTSALSVKSSISDAQSLKIRMQTHVAGNFIQTERKRISKSPKIHDLEQLKEVAANPEYALLAKEQEDKRISSKTQLSKRGDDLISNVSIAEKKMNDISETPNLTELTELNRLNLNSSDLIESSQIEENINNKGIKISFAVRQKQTQTGTAKSNKALASNEASTSKSSLNPAVSVPTTEKNSNDIIESFQMKENINNTGIKISYGVREKQTQRGTAKNNKILANNEASKNKNSLKTPVSVPTTENNSSSDLIESSQMEENINNKGIKISFAVREKQTQRGTAKSNKALASNEASTSKSSLNPTVSVTRTENNASGLIESSQMEENINNKEIRVSYAVREKQTQRGTAKSDKALASNEASTSKSSLNPAVSVTRTENNASGLIESCQMEENINNKEIRVSYAVREKQTQRGTAKSDKALTNNEASTSKSSLNPTVSVTRTENNASGLIESSQMEENINNKEIRVSYAVREKQTQRGTAKSDKALTNNEASTSKSSLNPTVSVTRTENNASGLIESSQMEENINNKEIRVSYAVREKQIQRGTAKNNKTLAKISKHTEISKNKSSLKSTVLEPLNLNELQTNESDTEKQKEVQINKQIERELDFDKLLGKLETTQKEKNQIPDPSIAQVQSSKTKALEKMDNQLDVDANKTIPTDYPSWHIVSQTGVNETNASLGLEVDIGGNHKELKIILNRITVSNKEQAETSSEEFVTKPKCTKKQITSKHKRRPITAQPRTRSQKIKLDKEMTQTSTENIEKTKSVEFFETLKLCKNKPKIDENEIKTTDLNVEPIQHEEILSYNDEAPESNNTSKNSKDDSSSQEFCTIKKNSVKYTVGRYSKASNKIVEKCNQTEGMDDISLYESVEVVEVQTNEYQDTPEQTLSPIIVGRKQVLCLPDSSESDEEVQIISPPSYGTQSKELEDVTVAQTQEAVPINEPLHSFQAVNTIGDERCETEEMTETVDICVQNVNEQTVAETIDTFQTSPESVIGGRSKTVVHLSDVSDSDEEVEIITAPSQGTLLKELEDVTIAKTQEAVPIAEKSIQPQDKLLNDFEAPNKIGDECSETEELMELLEVVEATDMMQTNELQTTPEPVIGDKGKTVVCLPDVSKSDEKVQSKSAKTKTAIIILEKIDSIRALNEYHLQNNQSTNLQAPKSVSTYENVETTPVKNIVVTTNKDQSGEKQQTPEALSAKLKIKTGPANIGMKTNEVQFNHNELQTTPKSIIIGKRKTIVCLPDVSKSEEKVKSKGTKTKTATPILENIDSVRALNENQPQTKQLTNLQAPTSVSTYQNVETNPTVKNIVVTTNKDQDEDKQQTAENVSTKLKHKTGPIDVKTNEAQFYENVEQAIESPTNFDKLVDTTKGKISVDIIKTPKRPKDPSQNSPSKSSNDTGMKVKKAQGKRRKLYNIVDASYFDVLTIEEEPSIHETPIKAKEAFKSNIKEFRKPIQETAELSNYTQNKEHNNEPLDKVSVSSPKKRSREEDIQNNNTFMSFDLIFQSLQDSYNQELANKLTNSSNKKKKSEPGTSKNSHSTSKRGAKEKLKSIRSYPKLHRHTFNSPLELTSRNPVALTDNGPENLGQAENTEVAVAIAAMAQDIRGFKDDFSKFHLILLDIQKNVNKINHKLN